MLLQLTVGLDEQGTTRVFRPVGRVALHARERRVVSEISDLHTVSLSAETLQAVLPSGHAAGGPAHRQPKGG